MIIMPMELQNLMDELKVSNAETYYHSIHVKNYVLKLLKETNMQGFTTYTKSEIDRICKGAILHDLGKLYVKNSILTKETKLTPEEKERMIMHTRLGFEAVEPYLTEEEHDIIKNICIFHHERFDGNGYEGKANLPLYVKIVALCDVFDALTSERIYRRAMSFEDAFDMIERGECGAFEKHLIDCLKKIVG